jgi:hypothetical protein
MFRAEEYSSTLNILLHNTAIYQTNMPHIPENRKLHNHCGENLKFHDSSDVSSNEKVRELEDNDSTEESEAKWMWKKETV